MKYWDSSGVRLLLSDRWEVRVLWNSGITEWLKHCERVGFLRRLSDLLILAIA